MQIVEIPCNKRLIANIHTKKFEKEEFSLKNYLKETDFMAIEYNPIIDITSKQIEEEYLGIFSYKFYIKNLVTKKKLLQQQ